MNVLRASMSEVDPAIRDLVDRESRRQEEGLELIASENYVPRAVLEAQGSILTNKYAEGYPGRKYYGGCEHVEEIERIAVDRAKSLFGAEHANVQPHSGTSANMAVLLAALDPGDPILAMRLDQGGHLSHGHHLSFAGQLYEGIAYGVRRDTETIDYEEVERLARERRPRMIVAGASAYPRFIDFERFRRIADETGALLWVDMAHIAGLVAGGVHPNPVPFADFVTTTTHKTLRGPRGAIAFSRASAADALDRSVFPGVQGGPLVHVIAAKAICLSLAAAPEFRAYAERVRENARVLAEALAERGFRIVSGGTDNHLILVDLRPKGISGAQAERILGEAGITVNKNLIPFDPERPAVTSGIRLGTPALTTRGLGPEEMRSVAEAIDRILSRPEDESERLRVRSLVRDLVRSFPLDFSRP